MENRTCPLCPVCAVPRTPEDAAGLAWSSWHDPDGSVGYLCPACTREQLWRIEAMLPVPAASARVVLRPAA